MLSPSMEDYLEVIYRLSEDAGSARVSEIAEIIQVRRPSVSKALRRLAQTGYVEHDPYGEVVLTKTGQRVARRQVRSHQVVSSFLSSILGLPGDKADREACQIEHTAGPLTVSRMERFIAYVERGPDAYRRWLESFVDDCVDVEARSGRSPGDGPASFVAREERFVERERSWKSPV